MYVATLYIYIYIAHTISYIIISVSRERSLEAKCLWGSVHDDVHPSVSGRQTKGGDEDSKRPGTLAWDCPGHTPKYRKGLSPFRAVGHRLSTELRETHSIYCISQLFGASDKR